MFAKIQESNLFLDILSVHCLDCAWPDDLDFRKDGTKYPRLGSPQWRHSEIRTP